jgi:hypothetical protein
MEGGARPGSPRAPGSPRRSSRSTTPEQRAAARKAKEERQRRARRRAQGLPEEEPAPAPAAKEPAADVDAILQQAEAARIRAAEEAAAAAAATAEAERQKAEQEALAAARAAEERAAAAAAKQQADAEAAAAAAAASAASAAAAKLKAEEEASRAASEAERKQAAAAAAAVAAAAPASASASASASAAPAAASASASATAAENDEEAARARHELAAKSDADVDGLTRVAPAVVVLEVSKGSAGFTCAEDLTVVKLPPGKKGSQAEAAGVTIGMRCVAFQGAGLDSDTTWDTLKDQVKAAQKPWVFTFSSGGNEVGSNVDEVPDAAAQSVESVEQQAEQVPDEEAEEPLQQEQGTTVEMTTVTRTMIDEGWSQPTWILPQRHTPSVKPSAPTKPNELPGIEAGPENIVVAWTMPSGEPLALDFDVQVKRKSGGSMTVVARDSMAVNHNDRYMVGARPSAYLHTLSVIIDPRLTTCIPCLRYRNKGSSSSLTSRA